MSSEKNIDDQIKQAAKDVAVARDRQTVQEEFAPDYLDIRGVKFFKPKVAHIWVFNRLKHSVAAMASLDDFGVCIVYALAHTQNAVRNKIMPSITRGTIVDDAYNFIIEHDLENTDIEEVLEKLAFKTLKFKDEEEEAEKKTASSPTGGQG